MKPPSYPEVFLNDAQQCYLVRYGRYTNSVSYDHCFATTTQLIQRMNSHHSKTSGLLIPVPHDSLRGTLEGYSLYKQTLVTFAKHAVASRTWYPPQTPPSVQAILDNAIQSQNVGGGVILRLFFGNPSTGLDQCEEEGTVGFVGRSGGLMRVPLLFEPLRAFGETRPAKFGAALATQNVLRIIRVNDGLELYRCKNYHLPKITVVASDVKAYAAAVELDGELKARFMTEEQTLSFVALIQGHRLHEPFRSQQEAEMAVATA